MLKILVVFSLCGLTFGSWAQSTSTENSSPVVEDGPVKQDGGSSGRADSDRQGAFLAQQLRFYKISRKVLSAAAPACATFGKSSIPPGWALDVDTKEGRPRIIGLIPDSEAHAAGLQIGDVIQSLGNEPINPAFGVGALSDGQRVTRAWVMNREAAITVSIDRAGVQTKVTVPTQKGCAPVLELSGIKQLIRPYAFSRSIPVSVLGGLSDDQIAALVLQTSLTATYQTAVFSSDDANTAASGMIYLLAFSAALRGKNSANMDSKALMASNRAMTELKIEDLKSVFAATAAVMVHEGYDFNVISSTSNLLEKKRSAASESAPENSINKANEPIDPDRQTAALAVVEEIKTNSTGWYSKFGNRLPIGRLLLGSKFNQSSMAKAGVEATHLCEDPVMPTFPYSFGRTPENTLLPDLESFPFLNEGMANAYQQFKDKPYPRAFVVTANGKWTSSWGYKDAPEHALLNCVQRHKTTCYLLAFNHSYMLPDSMDGAVCWGAKVQTAQLLQK